MEHVKTFHKLIGVDVGYHESNLHPPDGEGCVGKSGINKNFTLVQLIELAYKMEEKPNIIIKAGPNAKWYLKKINPDHLMAAIDKQNWRDLSRSTMYIIEWDD